MKPFQPTIGLEVHAQLKTQSKLFCACSTAFGAPPNSHGCPVCLGMPGSLPVLNARAVELTMRTALALHCSVTPSSIFARKNYFYPDLPKGYQVSQYQEPLSTNGFVEIGENGERRRVRIHRIHLEEDAGKLIHDQEPSASHFDVNRCGTPLMEIVTEPDIRSAHEAFLYLTALKETLEYLDVCDCNMEEGSLRCDANVSLRPDENAPLGTKTELKNMNSFHGVEKALESEISRQEMLLEDGEAVVQQTLLWDAKKGTVTPMRSKEEAHDYRYFPEPDLLPIRITEREIESVRASLPELPDQKRERLVRDFGIREYDARVLCGDRRVADFFEETAGLLKSPASAAKWIQNEVLRICRDRQCRITELPLPPEALAKLLMQIEEGAVSAQAGKTVLDEMVQTGRDAQSVIQEKGLTQISGEDEIGGILDRILEQNPKEVEALRGGKDKLIGFFVGQVMKETKGKANPGIVNSLIRKKVLDR